MVYVLVDVICSSKETAANTAGTVGNNLVQLTGIHHNCHDPSWFFKETNLEIK